MPTIKDVAKEAGVSIATVSYVLNKKDTFVSKETRRQVLEAIERIGYTPNVTARNLKSSQTRLIGYAWHETPNDQVNPVMDRFNYYLAQAAEAAGYHVLTFTHPMRQPLPVYDEFIRTQRVDALVVAGTVRADERIRFLIDADFPFVSFGRSNQGWDFPWVDTDGEQGVHTAMEYLIGLGHHKIAMAAWPEESISGSFRVQGYLDALGDVGIPFRPDYLVRGEHSEQAGRAAMAAWCNLPLDEQPTAVVAITDLVAVGVMNEAERRGLVVGRDLSVIGYDNVPMSQYLRPALTTLEQPILEIGRALMETLEHILRQDAPPNTHQLIPPRLVVRDSCSPPVRHLV